MRSSESGGAEVQVRAIARGDALAVASLIVQLGYSREPKDVAEWIDGLEARSEGQAAFVACLGDEVARIGFICAMATRL